MRIGEISRNTRETQIEMKLNLNGSGIFSGEVDCGFLKHMLELMTSHGRFDLEINAKGDTYVDDHHLVEDVGIGLGQAVKSALGDKRGITRYGSFLMPMDEALILTVLDISGRSFLQFDADFPTEKIGKFDTQLVEEFFLGFTRGLNATLHIKMMSGKNSHHIAEGIFKGFGRTLAQCIAFDSRFAGEIPSTKGLL